MSCQVFDFHKILFLSKLQQMSKTSEQHHVMLTLNVKNDNMCLLLSCD